VANGGFWSLTTYSSDGSMGENQLNKYGVGDRNNITYPGGELIMVRYSRTSDGSFQVLIQAQDPPSNWTNK
jgi:hypothetical protein